MTSRKKGPASKFTETGNGTLGDQAVAWARRKFGTDFDRSESIRDLQERLTSLGHKVFADGVMGPSTLAALRAEHETDASRSPSTASSASRTASSDDPASDAERAFEFKRAKSAAKRRAARTDLEEDGAVGSEEGAEDGGAERDIDEPSPEREEAQPQRDVEGLTAQPVALSDNALESVSEDRLGFAPYVSAVVRFLLAAQTRPPLALAINAPWGRGKTSFMNMIDGELHTVAQGTGVRVATTRFNPWKYSEAEQVWAAFVGNVARCIRDNLTPGQRFRFWLSRLWAKIRRNADFGLVVRVVVAVVFLTLLGLMLALEWSAILEALKKDYAVLRVFLAALSSSDSSGVAGWMGYLALILAVLLAVAALYIGFANKLGLNLLDYLEKTDFKDKIGTLSQFEDEMRRLTAAVPANMKVVVFVDDLDRCRGPVLGEIVEALQLADVSKSCIFVLGMDLNIVANVIETERQELAQSVDSGNGGLEHGSGYKFLEKIIQARLSLPDYGQHEMRQLIAMAMDPDLPPDVPVSAAKPNLQKDGTTSWPGASEKGVVDKVLETVGELSPFRPEEQIRDSSLVIQIATYYGSRHFQNPRRLKRFINGFRLQTYLAASSGPRGEEVERLARLLVLAEKWPALLERVTESEEAFHQCMAFLDKGEHPADQQGTAETHVEALGLRGLSDAEKKKLLELLLGMNLRDPFGFDELKALADWYGFCYYPGLTKDL